MSNNETELTPEEKWEKATIANNLILKCRPQTLRNSPNVQDIIKVV